MIKKTSYYSWRTGPLVKGCQLCVQGKKLVFFVTGLCSKHCYYCPISDQKKNKDVVYANEWPISGKRDIITEASLCNAKGAGITGGDPLIRLERTVKYIRMLKKRFGRKFHIHLYTPLNLVDEKKLHILFNSGLDEIRFHPDINNDYYWKKIELARKFRWKVGVEIPSIPGKKKQTLKLIDNIKHKVDFLNINELEVSDTNANRLVEKGFFLKDRISYGIKGSERLALDLLRYCDTAGLRAHYCTCTLKDKIQLAKRIKRRARHVAKAYDIVTGEGMLVRGAIYGEIVPGFSYKKKIAAMNDKEKKKVLNRLESMRNKLRKQFRLPSELIEVDRKKLRILTGSWIVQQIAPEIKYKCAVVKEYPTWDQLEIEVDFYGNKD